MAERRRTLLESIGNGGLIEMAVEDVRRGVRRRATDALLDGVVRERVDEVISRVRRRP